MSAILPPYAGRLKLIDLTFLQTRNKVLRIALISKLMKGYVDSPVLFSLMDRCPRNYDPIKRFQCRADYKSQQCLPVLAKLYNPIGHTHGLVRIRIQSTESRVSFSDYTVDAFTFVGNS